MSWIRTNYLDKFGLKLSADPYNWVSADLSLAQPSPIDNPTYDISLGVFDTKSWIGHLLFYWFIGSSLFEPNPVHAMIWIQSDSMTGKLFFLFKIKFHLRESLQLMHHFFKERFLQPWAKAWASPFLFLLM